MANSKYEYVRLYEQPDRLPLGNWIVIRIDGRGFHRFSNKHDFAKPNDLRAIMLMNKAAEGVLRDVQDVVLGYGVSDEYSTRLYSRRASKLISTVVSTFTAHYIAQWPAYFPHSPLVAPTEPATSTIDLTATLDLTEKTDEEHSPEHTLLPTGPLPTFDARAVCYPRLREIRDYLSWRQADCHINNLHNTTFWALVQQGDMTNHRAEQALAGTVAADKNEILWRRFGINYNDEPTVWRKGSVIYRQPGELEMDGDGDAGKGADSASAKTGEHSVGSGLANDSGANALSKTQTAKQQRAKRKMQIVVSHEDIIQDRFWVQRPWLLVE